RKRNRTHKRNKKKPRSQRNPNASRKKNRKRSNQDKDQESSAMAPSFSRTRLRLLISAVLLSGLIACGGPSQEIVGKWQSSSDPSAVVSEFAEKRLFDIGSAPVNYRLA